MRRADVDTLGGWDPVRVSADDDFLQRARAAFGKKGAFQDVLPEVPLTFLLNHEASLTNRKGTHLRSLDFGIRKEYAQQAAFWRDGRPSGPDAARFALDRTDAKTPFPVPAKLMSRRATRDTAYNLILVSDLSLLGGTRRCNEGYIAAATDLGCRIGLFHWPRYDLSLRPDIDAEYRRMSYLPNVDILVPEDVVECDTVLIHHPPILRYPIDAVPRIKAERILILANQSPKQTWDTPPRYYFPDQVDATCRRLFGREPIWAPISPAIRRVLLELGGYERMTGTDWFPPFNGALPPVSDRKCARQKAANRPVIGRHSRDGWAKWPASGEDIRSAYCAESDIRVEILGGARHADRILGGVPGNWRVSDFDATPVEDFLQGIDFFVNFINEDSVEAFSRNIMEAMAHGIPAILPTVFRETFGDAAVYCAPDEVESVVRRLWRDELGYAEMSRRGLAFVEAECSNRVVKARLRSLLGVGQAP